MFELDVLELGGIVVFVRHVDGVGGGVGCVAGGLMKCALTDICLGVVTLCGSNKAS